MNWDWRMKNELKNKKNFYRKNQDQLLEVKIIKTKVEILIIKWEKL